MFTYLINLLQKDACCCQRKVMMALYVDYVGRTVFAVVRVSKRTYRYDVSEHTVRQIT
jgi:hypothetical protein